MILSLADFQERGYKIPNQNESPDLLSWIEEKEYEVLIWLFGLNLYNEVMDSLDESAPEQKFLDLLNGVEYQVNEVGHKWVGLANLLKPAVYSMWIDQGSFKFTNIGWVQNSPQENSTTVDSYQFVVTYWNMYCNVVDSFYLYMKEHEEDFDSEWVFCKPATKNRFGI